MYVLVVYLDVLKHIWPLKKKGFLLLIQLSIFLISSRVFLFIILNADFIILIPTFVSILKCQRIKQMFFSLSEKKI